MQVTLDNTIGAAFLCLSVSCMWAIYNTLSKHHDILPSPNQPFRNCHRSITFILHQLSQRLDLSKSLGEYRCKLPWKKFWCILTCTRLWSSCRQRFSSLTRGGVQWSSPPYRILANLNMIFTVHCVYYYLIVNFGNPESLETMVWYVYSASDLFYTTSCSCSFIFIWTGASRWSTLYITHFAHWYLANNSPASGPRQCMFSPNFNRNCILTLAGF
jgi:hypothetical protein